MRSILLLLAIFDLASSDYSNIRTIGVQEHLNKIIMAYHEMNFPLLEKLAPGGVDGTMTLGADPSQIYNVYVAAVGKYYEKGFFAVGLVEEQETPDAPIKRTYLFLWKFVSNPESPTGYILVGRLDDK